MRQWIVPFASPGAGPRYDSSNEAAFRLEVQRALESLPALIEQRLASIEDKLAELETRIEALEP